MTGQSTPFETGLVSVKSDYFEPASGGDQTPEPMLNKVDATRKEPRRGSA
jgi:hypothetical protein